MERRLNYNIYIAFLNLLSLILKAKQNLNWLLTNNENYGRKRFDFFMNVLRIQDSLFEDFVFAGLTTESFHLLDRYRYENSEKVKSSITDEYGYLRTSD